MPIILLLYESLPYMLVVGAKEEEDQLVAVRSRKDGDQGQKSLDAFIADMKEEIRKKQNNRHILSPSEKRR